MVSHVSHLSFDLRTMLTLSFKYFIDLFSKVQEQLIFSVIIWLIVKKEPYELSLMWR